MDYRYYIIILEYICTVGTWFKRIKNIYYMYSTPGEEGIDFKSPTNLDL